MSADDNLEIARRLLKAIGTGCEPDAIAAMFHAGVVVEFPGDIGALPWIGRKVGRGAIVDFISASRTLLARDAFEVHDLLSSDARATIVGVLTSRVIATGRSIRSPFAILLTVADGTITEFLMIEDSFAVSLAARP